MKNVIVWTLVSLCALSVSGQQAGAGQRVTKKGLDSLVLERYEEPSATWAMQLKYEYLYDGCGKTTQVTELTWDMGLPGWSNAFMEEFYYNPSAQLVMRIRYDWDDVGMDWVENEKDELEYTTSGNLDVLTTYAWIESSSQWLPEVKKGYSYDIEGVKEVMTWLWITSTSSFEKSGLDVYDYLPGGNLASITCHTWNVTQNIFEPASKFEYTWNASNHPETIIFLIYDPSITGYQKQHKLEYIYDLAYNVGTLQVYFFDEITVHWVIAEKDEFTYDNQYSYNDLLLPLTLKEENLPVMFLHMPTNSIRSVHSIPAGWQYSSRVGYHYSTKSISQIGEPDQPVKVRIYPNPASGCLSIDGLAGSGPHMVQFLDTRGAMVAEHQLTNGQNVDVSNLPRGFYLCRIISGQGPVAMRKVVLE